MKKVISSFVLFFALSATVAFGQAATKSCSGGAAESKSCCKAGAEKEGKACCSKASASTDGVSKEAQQVKYVSSEPATTEKKVRRVSAVKAKPASKQPSNKSSR